MWRVVTVQLSTSQLLTTYQIFFLPLMLITLSISPDYTLRFDVYSVEVLHKKGAWSLQLTGTSASLIAGSEFSRPAYGSD